MRRRVSVALLAGVLLAGLVAAPGAPAGAQEFGVLEIDPDGGVPGDIVHTQLPVEVIDEECVGSVDELRAQRTAYGDAMFNPLFAYIDGQSAAGDFDPTNDAHDFSAITLFMLLLLFNDGEVAPDIWEGLFVTSFVDPVTQEMVGETGSFDPSTGEGEIVVPEVAPGLWAVAAVCLGVNPAATFEGTVWPAIAAGEQWMLENFDAPYPEPSLSSGYLAVLRELAPVFLGVDPLGDGILIAQGGPWVDLFCVWNAEGFCATPPGPVGPIDALLDESDGEGDLAGEEALEALLDGLGTDGNLVAVAATPTFTG